MANLSITNAWNETTEFAKREARLLFPVAFLLVALPSAIMQIIMPPQVPGQPPEAGLWMALLPVVIILSLIGTLAITHLALKPGSSVGEALQVGAARFIFLLGSVVLLSIAGGILILPLALIAAGIGAAAGDAAGAAAVVVVVLVLLCLPILVYFWVRLMLMTPVAAAEAGGSIAIIRRSWVLSRGHFWRLLGFVVLFVIVVLVLSIAVGAIGGLIIFAVAGMPTPGSLPMVALLLVSALLNAVVGAFFATFVARVYAQLAGPDHSEVFA